MSVYLARFKALKSEIRRQEVLTKPTEPPFVSFGSNPGRHFSENSAISLTVNDRTSEPTAVMTSWPPEVQLLVDWFSTLDPPPEPFYLQDHMYVLDPTKFFGTLHHEIEVGPRGPRARMGTLQADLKKLKAYLN